MDWMKWAIVAGAVCTLASATCAVVVLHRLDVASTVALETARAELHGG